MLQGILSAVLMIMLLSNLVDKSGFDYQLLLFKLYLCFWYFYKTWALQFSFFISWEPNKADHMKDQAVDYLLH